MRQVLSKRIAMTITAGVIALTLALFLGSCKSEDEKDREKAFKGFEKMGQALDTAEKKEEQIKADVAKDRTVLYPKAIEKFKSAIEIQYGTDVAEQAEYRVIRVKDFGDAKWEVHGIYEGLDDRGRSMEADWVVTMEVFLGGLQTTKTSLGERRYLND